MNVSMHIRSRSGRGNEAAFRVFSVRYSVSKGISLSPHGERVRVRGNRTMLLNARLADSAFTLIEVMLALAISAIILAAIGGVFYSAIRLRDRTTAALDEAAPLHQAMSIMRRDFAGAIPPGSTYPLAGDFKCGSLGAGNGGSSGEIQVFTTTGVINDRVPWGDIQEVFYELREPTSGSRNNTGRDLIRTVTRNLLATGTAESDEQWILGNVQSLQFSCFDGQNWRDNWDTSAGDTNLPAAVKIRVLTSTDSSVDLRSMQPFELVVPVLSVTHTNGTSTSSSTSTGG
jgi:type II secretion system protein J